MAIREEVDEYRTVRDPAIAAEVLAHAVEHVHLIARCGRQNRVPAGAELDFVRARGAQRARQLMPLDALQESYLIGQRITWEAIVGAAGDTPEGLRIAQELTAWTFRYTHVINVAVAEGFLTESHALASEVERGRRDLLDRLLSGQPAGPDEERRAEGLGLRPDAEHAVVVGTHDGGPDSERIAMRALAPQDPFVVARGDEIVAIVPIARPARPARVARRDRARRGRAGADPRRAVARRREHRVHRAGRDRSRLRRGAPRVTARRPGGGARGDLALRLPRRVGRRDRAAARAARPRPARPARRARWRPTRSATSTSLAPPSTSPCTRTPSTTGCAACRS